MEYGECPVCFKNLNSKNLDQVLKKSQKTLKINCPFCGIELQYEPMAEKKSIKITKSRKFKEFHPITMGIEVESFSINLAEMKFYHYQPIYPKDGIEIEEEFKNDQTIGSEYNFPVFTSLQEAFSN